MRINRDPPVANIAKKGLPQHVGWFAFEREGERPEGYFILVRSVERGVAMAGHP